MHASEIPQGSWVRFLPHRRDVEAGFTEMYGTILEVDADNDEVTVLLDGSFWRREAEEQGLRTIPAEEIEVLM